MQSNSLSNIVKSQSIEKEKKIEKKLENSSFFININNIIDEFFIEINDFNIKINNNYNKNNNFF